MQVSTHDRQVVRFGPFTVDLASHELWNDEKIPLQEKPFQILVLLLERPGQLVTRDELQHRLWSTGTFVDFDHSINTAVKKLREALQDDAEQPRFIETLPRRGYRFIGDVTFEVSANAIHTAGFHPAQETTASRRTRADALVESHPEGSRRMGWKRTVVICAAVLSLVAAGAAVYSDLKPEPKPRIVGSHVLTKTGGAKWFARKPFVDRDMLYFFEQRPSGWALLGVPAAGGEVSGGPAIKGSLRDISRDGSQLITVSYDTERKQTDLWTESPPSGIPRLVVRDSTSSVVWASDARGMFFARNNNTELYRANADGTGVKQLASIPGFYYPHLSPDGTRLRFTENRNTLRLWEIGTDGRNLRSPLGGRKNVWGGSWSPDGKHYFFSSWDGDRWSLFAVSEMHSWWQKAKASEPQPLTFGPMSIGTPAISKDGKQLYALGMERHGELSVYDSKTAKFVPYLGGSSVCYVDFSRDGQWIAYVSYPEGTLWRSRVDGRERRQLTSPPLAVQNPRWSPDAKRIAFTDLSNGDRREMADDSPHRIYAISAEGGTAELLLAGNSLHDPTWSPDGNSIAYGYGQPYLTGPLESEVRILDLQTQESTAVPGPKGIWTPRWSPDGQYLVAFFENPPQELMLYSFASGKWEDLASGEFLAWPSWSHDSRFVYLQDYGLDSLVRVNVSTHKKEKIASLQGIRVTAYYMDRWDMGWFGLTPDDRPLTTRDTGINELYAFDLEYK